MTDKPNHNQPIVAASEASNAAANDCLIHLGQTPRCDINQSRNDRVIAESPQAVQYADLTFGWDFVTSPASRAPNGTGRGSYGQRRNRRAPLCLALTVAAPPFVAEGGTWHPGKFSMVPSRTKGMAEAAGGNVTPLTARWTLRSALDSIDSMWRQTLLMEMSRRLFNATSPGP
jgi:hypothetical protein